MEQLLAKVGLISFRYANAIHMSMPWYKHICMAIACIKWRNFSRQTIQRNDFSPKRIK